MWGVGTLLGPAAGGLFAQYGSVALGIRCPGRSWPPLIAVLVPIALPARPGCGRRGRYAIQHPGVVAAVCSARRRWRSASPGCPAMTCAATGAAARPGGGARRACSSDRRPPHCPRPVLPPAARSDPARSSGSISPSACWWPRRWWTCTCRSSASGSRTLRPSRPASSVWHWRSGGR